MGRRLLAILWTLYDDLRCELSRLPEGHWELAVWRGTDRMRVAAFATLEDVHVAARAWRENVAVQPPPESQPTTRTSDTMAPRKRSHSHISVLLVDGAHD